MVTGTRLSPVDRALGSIHQFKMLSGSLTASSNSRRDPVFRHVLIPRPQALNTGGIWGILGHG